MLRRIPESWIVWVIVGAVVAFDAGAAVLGILDRHVQSLAATIMFTPTTIGFAVFGALIVWRHRAHSIGWLFVAVAFFFALCHNLAQNYAVYTLAVDPGSLPAGKAAFWLASTALDTVYIGVMLLLLLLFPNGRPLTRRWRPVVAAALVATACGLSRGGLDFTFSPPLEAYHNPIAASGGLETGLEAVQAAGAPFTVVALLGGFASMVLRFRRSAGVERQQMKWVVAGVLIWFAVFAASLPLSAAGLDGLAPLPFVLSIVLFPAVMGFAIRATASTTSTW
jgi:two-component system NarL family sensor kinase